MGMGLFIAFVYQSGMSCTTSVLLLSFFLGWDLVLETIRLRVPSINQRIMRLWGPIMRTSEVNQMSGTPHYLASAIIAIGIFPKPVAILSIIYLACGDPIASLVGILWGDRSIRLANGKSVVGTAAGVLTCSLVTFFFLRVMNLPVDQQILLTMIGGIAGGMAELVPVDVDDNFTIPTISGFILWLAFILMGI